jgi:hypothetical protein
MRMDLLPRQHQSDHTLSILILRSRASGVSKDESPAAATAGAKWFETALTRLLTMRMDLLPRQHQSDHTLSILILRSRASGV